jgi:hypothetical protein
MLYYIVLEYSMYSIWIVLTITGLRRQAGTIRNEAEMIDVYQKEMSTKYTNKLGDLKKRLQELGLEVDGNKKEKCARLASFLYKNKISV